MQKSSGFDLKISLKTDCILANDGSNPGLNFTKWGTVLLSFVKDSSTVKLNGLEEAALRLKVSTTNKKIAPALRWLRFTVTK